LQLVTHWVSYKNFPAAAEHEVQVVAEFSHVKHVLASHLVHINLSLTKSLVPKNPYEHLHNLDVKEETSSRPVSHAPHCLSLVQLEQPGGQRWQIPFFK
jgi:hypothetical protein